MKTFGIIACVGIGVFVSTVGFELQCDSNHALHAEMARLNATVEALNKTIQEKEQIIQNLRNEVARLHSDASDIHKLRAENHRLVTSLKELDPIYNSPIIDAVILDY